MAAPIRAVVFDLADVLFAFDGAASMARLSSGRVGPSAFEEFWQSPIADAFYRGRSEPNSFAEAAVAALDLSIAAAEFLAEFKSWLRGPFPGAMELVAEARRHVTVACLSNTNELDARRFREEFDLDRQFDHCFFSNEIGLVKPEPECFIFVLERMGCGRQPATVAFFDDNLHAVAAAARLGMTAFQVTSVPVLRGHLHELGVLTSEAASRGA